MYLVLVSNRTVIRLLHGVRSSCPFMTWQQSISFQNHFHSAECLIRLERLGYTVQGAVNVLSGKDKELQQI